MLRTLLDVPDAEVFVSFASEDRDAAEGLAAALQQRGLRVGLSHRLPGDESFEQEIRSAIRNASLFVPLLSRNTLGSGYFRREWSIAIERSMGMRSEQRFIVPLVLDDEVSPATAGLPEAFTRVGWGYIRNDAEVEQMSERFVAISHSQPRE